ncbi:TVP38/TMEM64 family protein [Amycolatopsis sp. H20-H5]|uniref:TVP38/TMEM64 family protein n=1 Tax=Amycolatopsis sp. H20-H5 TaxID=3046309 RepID=UPI002DC00001|nr:TVP38/TMEM64 family protein [Amycolatopsis sp. H20-H5]MEC3975845.1 TVP38/TMEM64 family protein [Amycolatopsis sp. H20-H5]
MPQARSDHRGDSSAMISILRSPWPRLVLFALVLGLCGWFALTRGSNTLALAQDWTADLGAGGIVVFVLLYAVATMLLLPATVLSAAAGVLYGPLVGIAVVWVGAVLGACGSFGLGRVLSRSAVEQLAGRRIDRLNGFLTERGTVAMLLVRLVPLFPFALVNYGSAVTAITFRRYLIGTGIGILPGTAAYVTLGGSLNDPTSPAFILSAAALLVLALGGAAVAKRMSRRHPTSQGRD